jgi:hypothetical protein
VGRLPLLRHLGVSGMNLVSLGPDGRPLVADLAPLAALSRLETVALRGGSCSIQRDATMRCGCVLCFARCLLAARARVEGAGGLQVGGQQGITNGGGWLAKGVPSVRGQCWSKRLRVRTESRDDGAMRRKAAPFPTPC